MGLFASKPEEPFQWAGLPSEPDLERTGDVLPEGPPIDPFAITTDGGRASISISIDALTAPEEAAEPAAGSDADPED
ncbi:hypothetical protein [Microbacterium terrisoli]|jgi:hypothetical protein|uniref:hypothetical protein n=1 Tax=Microbacterium terrisoli TaxID=3242192 RepID=UPI002805C928|nr:hypothetical protein [Microbacterium protaetiae]